MIYSPFGEKATQFTRDEFPGRVNSSFPRKFQTFIEFSSEPEPVTIYLTSGETSTEFAYEG